MDYKKEINGLNKMIESLLASNQELRRKINQSKDLKVIETEIKRLSNIRQMLRESITSLKEDKNDLGFTEREKLQKEIRSLKTKVKYRDNKINSLNRKIKLFREGVLDRL